MLASSAHAAFPGANGRIAFQTNRDGNFEIYSMNADGTDQVNLTNSPATDDRRPAWSPDGRQLAFQRSVGTADPDVYVMGADGTSQLQIATDGRAPAWSPDGRQIVALTRFGHVFVMNADGSGRRIIWDDSPDFLDCGDSPVWSPDGEEIAFTRYVFCGDGSDLVAVRPDGSDLRFIASASPAQFVADAQPDWSPGGGRLVYRHELNRDPDDELSNPVVRDIKRDGSDPRDISACCTAVWSPDGSKLAVDNPGSSVTRSIFVMNPDGSGATTIATNAGSPDWQPLLRGYPRPLAANGFRVPLAIAYVECRPASQGGSPNRTHGPGLEAPSCSPASQTSGHLTVGSLDANGKLPQAAGEVQLRVCPTGTTPEGQCANPQMSGADVRMNLYMRDVRSWPSLLDYTGELQTVVTLQITDKLNSPHPGGSGPGTAAVLPLSFTAPCAPTVSTEDIGSTCHMVTSANAVAAGAVQGGKRANWEVKAIDVFDGGPDGSAGTADNTLFARQGIFVP
jgi:WD40-like Beta Propeller Repeat